MIKLSFTDKMPCPSWSTQAVIHCPGARVKGRKRLADACEGCYARFGNYNRPNVKNARMHNGEDWKRDSWVMDMVQAMEKLTEFRWFDSGDAYHIDLLYKIWTVMIMTPWVKHWMPTRMYKFDKFRHPLTMMAAMKNVCVRYSSDSINGETIEGPNTSTIQNADRIKNWDHVCMAYERDGKCGDCRMCWDKSIPVITYPQHGAPMARLDLKLTA